MKNIVLLFMFFSQVSLSQNNLTKQQKYFLNEINDAYGGKIYYANNYNKTSKIYKELSKFSGMHFPVVFNQTFRWGEAHYGGLIILDYSTINKNNDILAFVFAHEWGHQALGHQPNLYNPTGSYWKVRTSVTQDEDEADFYAGKFIRKYNYNIKAIVKYLNSLPVFNNDTQHSSNSKRAQNVIDGYNSISYNDLPKKTLEQFDYESIFFENFKNNRHNWELGRDYQKLSFGSDLKYTTNVYSKISKGKYKIRNLGNTQHIIGAKQLLFSADPNLEISMLAYLYSGKIEVRWDECNGEPDAGGSYSVYSNSIELDVDGNYLFVHHTRSNNFSNNGKEGLYKTLSSSKVYLKFIYENGNCKYYINNQFIGSRPASICGKGATISIYPGTDVAFDNIVILRKVN